MVGVPVGVSRECEVGVTVGVAVGEVFGEVGVTVAGRRTRPTGEGKRGGLVRDGKSMSSGVVVEFASSHCPHLFPFLSFFVFLSFEPCLPPPFTRQFGEEWPTLEQMPQR